MKYLKFDYEGLLKDYKANKNLVKSCEQLIKYYEKGIGDDLDYMDIIDNPDTVRELHSKLDEANLYVRLVDNAFSALKEFERESLRLFYIESYKADECAERLSVSLREFFRDKAVAYDKFCHIVWWQ